MPYEINESGLAHCQTDEDRKWVQDVKAEFEQQRALGIVAAPAISPDWAWIIDGSDWVANPLQTIKDAVAAGCAGVIWKASDTVQLSPGTFEDVGNHVSHTFYDVLQLCQDIITPEGWKGVPVWGYHFPHIDTDMPPFDPNSPSSCLDYRVIRNWLGIPIGANKIPRNCQGEVNDYEQYKMPDGTYNWQNTGKVVLADRVKTFQAWGRGLKAQKNPDGTPMQPYLKHSGVAYSSPGYINSYMPDMIVDIDNRSDYEMWLATWWFVQAHIGSFAEVPGLLAKVLRMPTIGNDSSKVKLCQLGTVAFDSHDPITGAVKPTEVDINIFKGNKVAWRTYNGLSSTPVHTCPEGFEWSDADNKCMPIAPDHTCPAGEHWDDTQGKCVPDVLPTEDLSLVLANQELMKAGLARLEARFDQHFK